MDELDGRKVTVLVQHQQAQVGLGDEMVEVTLDGPSLLFFGREKKMTDWKDGVRERRVGGDE